MPVLQKTKAVTKAPTMATNISTKYTNNILDILDFLGLLTNTTQVNRFISVTTESYSKLTKAILVMKTTILHVAMAVHENWIMPYGISSTIMMDNGL